MYGAIEQGPVDRAEWRWVLGWAAVVTTLACLPYIYAFAAAPSGHTFSGFLVNYQDGNSYLAKMREGYDGDWLFRLAFTTENQNGLLVFTLYLALGHLARLTGLPLVLVFHLARAFSGLFLLLTVYRLAAEFTLDKFARRWSFVIAAFGGGLALLSLLVGRNDSSVFVPVDLFVPEAIGFYSLLANPHFCLAFALQGWAILWVLNPPRWNRWLQLAVAALIGLGIVSMAPYLTPVAWASVAAGVLGVWRRDKSALWRTGVLLAASGLFLAYEFWAMNADPAIAIWARQNVTLSPPPVDVVLGLGLWLPLAAVGAWRAWREFSDRPILGALVVWLLLTLALLYFPYPLQRRFIGGVFVPLAVLGGAGTAWVVAQVTRGRWAVVGGLIVLGFSSNVLVLLALFSAPRLADPKVYLTNDESGGLRWLEARVNSDDVVLADSRLGLFVPGWTGARTVYGHPMETIDAAVKRAEVEAFYSGGDASLLNRYRVLYVVGGAAPAGWHSVFQSGDVVIYGR